MIQVRLAEMRILTILGRRTERVRSVAARPCRVASFIKSCTAACQLRAVNNINKCHVQEPYVFQDFVRLNINIAKLIACSKNRLS